MNTLHTQLLNSLAEFTAFARKRLSDPDLAADVVQDSLLKALKASSNIDEIGNAKAWFYRILRHTIIDLYRRKDVQQRGLARLQEEMADLPSPEEERVTCTCLGNLIATLKPKYAEAVKRLDIEGQSYDQVAAGLNVSTNNLKVRLHRARKQLRERLTTTCGICATHGCLDCTCGNSSERA